MFSLTVPNPRNRNVPIVQEFLSAYTRLGPAGVSPTTRMLASYIDARILIGALHRATAPTSAGVAKVLAQSPSTTLSGVTVHFHQNTGKNRSSLTILNEEGKMLW